MYNDAAAAGIFALFGAFIFIFLLIGIVGYVLMALGLMTMAQKRGIDNPWMAWIPVANLWIVGKLIGKMEIGGNTIEQPELILVIASVAPMVLGAIPVIGQLIGLASFIITLMAMYQLFKMYAPNNAVMFIVLAVIFNILAMGIILFRIKDNEPVLAVESAPESPEE